MTEQQRQRWLIGILVVVMPLVAWRFGRPWLLDLASGGGTIQRSARDRAAGGLGDREIVELQLAALEAPVGTYQPGRNIFRFYVPPPPPPPPPPPRQVVKPPPPPPPPPVNVKPQPPPVDVSLVGIIGPERRRIAIFVKEGELINARENDVIHDKFIVHKIGYQSVDLTFVGFPEAEPERLEIGG